LKDEFALALGVLIEQGPAHDWLEDAILLDTVRPTQRRWSRPSASALPSWAGTWCDMYIKQSIITARGKTYTRCEFESFDDLEAYFINEILGCTDVRSKVIGKVLIWAKKSD
jgi:hypothetical protein